MTKKQAVSIIQQQGRFVKVRIAKDGTITGMLKHQNYRYRKEDNTGGRRIIGNFNDPHCFALI